MDIRIDTNRWFAVQVQPRREIKTAQILRSKGYEEFVPLYSCKRKMSNPQVKKIMPLFAGYIFCRMANGACGPIVTTPGVIRMLGSKKGPIPVDDEEIEAIRIVLKAKLPAEPHPYLPVGARVRIEGGPLTGLEGILTDRGKKRLILSVQLVQSSVAVEIDNCAVEPIG